VYFGSWGVSHEIPVRQLEKIPRCRYAWFSHGPPDHLNADSVAEFGSHAVLLPNHDSVRPPLKVFGQQVVDVLRQWFCPSPGNSTSRLLDGDRFVQVSDLGVSQAQLRSVELRRERYGTCAT